MKKLITLLLVLTGMVGTVSATTKTFYVQDTYNKGNMYVYSHGGTGSAQSWRGIEMTTYEIIENQRIYTVEIDDSYSKFIINGYKDESEYQVEDFEYKDVTPGAYYYIYYSDGDHKNHLGTMTLHTYNFNVNTDPNHDFGTIKIHLFKDANPINGEWASNPPMTKTDNIYTYTFKSFSKSGGIGVVFHNDIDADRTDDLGAAEGDNNYVLKYNSSLAKKFRKAEKVTTNASGLTTYVNTEDLTISGATAYYATDNDNGSATAHSITYVPEGTPMLIKGDNSTTYYFEVAANDATVSSNAFKAGLGSAVASTDGSLHNYILSGNAFYQAGGKTVPTTKAYLQLSQAAAARPLIFDFENETTGIENTVKSEETKDMSFFNLAGQRVAQPSKGLYIMNGRKVVIK